MLAYPEIDPVALSLGPLKVHWYGLMYLTGFLGFWWLGMKRTARAWSPIKKKDDVSDLLFYGALGVILGGRIGYVLFYDFSAFLQDPLMLFRVWQGGMSFHGGLLGVMLAAFFYARKLKVTFLHLMDYIAPMVPIGLGAGRIGNFINGELWGRASDVPWAMVFPTGGSDPRHPSQLYQAALEGLALFTILWLFSNKERPIGTISGLFLIFYGLFRFAMEFVREPDAHLGFIAWGWLTMGQLLSLPMILGGVALYWWAAKRNRLVTQE